MNKDIFQGNWRQLKGAVQEQWGNLTDDMISQVDGNREKLLGAIQKSYGVAREEAERQVKKWEESFKDAA